MDDTLLELEQETEQLIKEFQSIKQMNSNLRASNNALLEEQNQLRSTANDASAKIKNIISRLKSIEATPAESDEGADSA